jgi:hypothetical protein
MAVDVSSSIEIARPRAQVAAFACDPDRVTGWYANIRQVDWVTSPPLAVGSEVAFVAHFLGRRLRYTYRVLVHDAGESFVMSTAQGPFAMETTYTWSDAPDGGTRMTLRNRGEPAGFSRMLAPFLSRAVRRANRKDLAALKRLLES